MDKIPVIVQARVGSSRFPNKSLQTILNRPMVYYVLKTLQASIISRVILAIPDTTANDILCDIAKELKVDCIRGPELNVLERYFIAAQKFKAPYYIRATADNPLVDYQGIVRLYFFLTENKLDYACEKGIPLGGGVEIFTYDSLIKTQSLVTTPEDKEHVTLFMKNHPELFKIGYLPVPEFLNYPDLRITVDYREDFEFVKKFYEKYYKGEPFKLTEIINLLRNEQHL